MSNKTLPITFVVPVFNVKSYLRQCLDSIIQVNIEKEIILIDDGSSDGSQEILEEYQLNYPFVTLVKQSNKGVSYARNIGIKLAKGKYIQFVDPDDFLLTEDYRRLIALADSSNIDILRGQYLWILSDDQHLIAHQPTLSLLFDIPSDKLSVISGGEIFLKAHLKQHFPVVWLGFFRTDILLDNNIFFEEGVSSAEDSIFMFDVLSINNINVLEVFETIYGHRFNLNSLSKKFNNSNRIKDTFKAIEKFKARYNYHSINNIKICDAIDILITDCCIHAYKDYQQLSDNDKLELKNLFDSEIILRIEKYIGKRVEL